MPKDRGLGAHTHWLFLAQDPQHEHRLQHEEDNDAEQWNEQVEDVETVTAVHWWLLTGIEIVCPAKGSVERNVSRTDDDGGGGKQC